MFRGPMGASPILWVQSQVGQGSTFTFTMPVQLEAQSSSE
jgi:hypothetical protein